MKILLVFGTRPEAIKMCPVIKEIEQRENMECSVCVTGQHKEMLEQVLQAFGVVPNYNLCVMKEEQTLYDITYAVMEGMRSVLTEVRPSIVLVHGDTTTAFAAALACFYEKVPVAHVEAGLRTHNLHSPYPEEFNRQVVDIVSEIYFAPTKQARQNLVAEGKPENKIYVTGNTAIDALRTTIRDDYDSDILRWAKGSKTILLTAHRRENWGEPLENIFLAVKDILNGSEDVKVIFPVHFNPLIRACAQRILGGEERVKMIEPLGVLDFHNIINKSFLVLTDSGGIQEEAPSLGKPVLVLREDTERPEGVQAGTLKLVGTCRRRIVDEVTKLLCDNQEYKRMSEISNPYGDGQASERIVNTLLAWVEVNNE